MPSLSSALGAGIALPKQFVQGTLKQTQNNIVGEFKQQSNSIQNQFKSGVQGIQHQIANAASGVVNSATSAAGAGISNAMSQAFAGNFSGAASTLGGIPTSVLGNAQDALGKSPIGSFLGFGKTDKPEAETDQTAQLGNTLKGILQRPDAYLTYNWYCIMPDVFSSDGVRFRLPWYYVEGAHVPFRVFDIVHAYRRGHDIAYLAGKYSVTGLNLSIYADAGVEALSYLMAYQSTQMESFVERDAMMYGGGFNTPSEYKKRIEFYCLSADKQVIFSIIYTGLIITNVQPISLESGSSTRQIYSVDCSVDDVFCSAGLAQPQGTQRVEAVNPPPSINYKPSDTVPVNTASAIPALNYTVASGS